MIFQYIYLYLYIPIYIYSPRNTMQNGLDRSQIAFCSMWPMPSREQ